MPNKDTPAHSTELPGSTSSGKVSRRTTPEALKWFLLAAEQGHARAQYLAGRLYYGGKGGVERDYNEAAKWLLRAAEQEHSYAQAWLSILYRQGWGVTRDYDEALRWGRRSAEQGTPFGQRRYAALLAWTQTDDHEALIEAYKWYTLALQKQPSDEGRHWIGKLEEKMTWDDIAEGKKRAKEWRERNP